MPFVFDFSKRLGDIHEVAVSPKGWTDDVIVEYCIAQAHPEDPVKSVVWRVKGTTHCFTIYEMTINRRSHGDYKSHFEEALTNFRLDYLRWFQPGEYDNADWKYEYERQFGRFILPDPGEGSEDKQN